MNLPTNQSYTSWKSDLTDKMKCSFFQAVVVSILLYGCTTWMLTKRLEKKLDGNYTRMLRAILNNPWRQHPTRNQLYGHLPTIMKTIQVRWTRHAGHCWRSRDELISDALLWTPTYDRTKAGWPARTYIQQLREDKGCSLEDLPEVIWRSGKRGSGISMLAVRHVDDDDIYLNVYKWLMVNCYCDIEIFEIICTQTNNSVLDNIWSHLTVCHKMSSGLCKNVINKMC